jgi:dihydropteroate synthase
MTATTRRHFVWKIAGRELLLGERTLLMGVLNVTPDSFSDGGRFLDPDRAFARAMELEEQGADIIDIGAESTKPGSERISEAEELRRLVPVLKRLHGKLNTPISVDTYKSTVAEKALEHGAALINEPSGLTFDPQMARVVAQHDAGLIITHMRGTPETWAKLAPLKDAIGTIRQDLDASTHRAVRAGIDRTRIAIDPGLGFGKRKEQNTEILAHLGALAALELPVAIGPSRKSFLRQTDDASGSVVQCATAAAVMACVLGGAHLVRVHDVPEMKAAALIADQMLSFAGTSDNNASRVVPPRSGGSAFRK